MQCATSTLLQIMVLIICFYTLTVNVFYEVTISRYRYFVLSFNSSINLTILNKYLSRNNNRTKGNPLHNAAASAPLNSVIDLLIWVTQETKRWEWNEFIVKPMLLSLSPTMRLFSNLNATKIMNTRHLHPFSPSL